ncbi:MAG: GH116 family glycosyl-hydrolase [Ginsengibacter sp.]
MKEENNRRSFIKKIAIGGLGTAIAPSAVLSSGNHTKENESSGNLQKSTIRKYNGIYQAGYLNRLAFPIGGIGAGMFCLEGTGAISHLSIRNRPEIFNEPSLFAAIEVKGIKNGVKVLEGSVPDWKIFGQRGSGNGDAGSTYGLPRFINAEFETKFPYGNVTLRDSDLPLKVKITGWSPFIPTDEDSSSLPVGALEYSFKNTGPQTIEAVFSFNTKNFVASDREAVNNIRPCKNGFVLNQEGTKGKPFLKSSFAIFTDNNNTIVDHCWFRGGWWDPLTMAWNDVKEGKLNAREPVEKDAPGASLFVPFSLAPGASKTVKLLVSWYTPLTTLHIGEVTKDEKKNCDPTSGCCAGPSDLGVANGKKNPSADYSPWYSSQFKNIDEVIEYWTNNYKELSQKTKLFSDSFYKSSLPSEVMEAVAANLTIIKSPTVLRQYDGRLWNWEGCGDDGGCCHGSCTHVWNYAQAMPHLFPTLERSLRNTEFCENQNVAGHQGFRANLPISPLKHDFYAAADGQLGGIMKVHRDWRISGDNDWLARIYPMVKVSMDYCITTWDPRDKGIVEEPHHNTYDIEFWGPDGMCTSFYLGALTSIIEMGSYLKKEVGRYKTLFQKGKQYLETKLYNGEYFTRISNLKPGCS